jgi:hypothetical protein
MSRTQLAVSPADWSPGAVPWVRCYWLIFEPRTRSVLKSQLLNCIMQKCFLFVINEDLCLYYLSVILWRWIKSWCYVVCNVIYAFMIFVLTAFCSVAFKFQFELFWEIDLMLIFTRHSSDDYVWFESWLHTANKMNALQWCRFCPTGKLFMARGKKKFGPAWYTIPLLPSLTPVRNVNLWSRSSCK